MSINIHDVRQAFVHGANFAKEFQRTNKYSPSDENIREQRDSLYPLPVEFREIVIKGKTYRFNEGVWEMLMEIEPSDVWVPVPEMSQIIDEVLDIMKQPTYPPR